MPATDLPISPAALPHPDAPAWLSAAGRPAFEELRNVMLMVGLRVSGVRRALSEMVPSVEEYLCPEADDDLQHAAGAMSDLSGAMLEIEGGLETLRSTLRAVEELVVAPRRSTRLREVIGIADRLAEHHTRPIGGVRRQPVPFDAPVDLPRTMAIAILGTAFSLLGLRLAATMPGQPIELGFSYGEHSCAISFGTALDATDVEVCARALARMFGDHAPVAIAARGAELVIELPLAI